MLFFCESLGTIHLTIKYLCKIIYHNITPSAVYDAAKQLKIARKFSQEILKAMNFRNGTGGRTRTDMSVKPARF